MGLGPAIRGARSGNWTSDTTSHRFANDASALNNVASINHPFFLLAVVGNEAMHGHPFVRLLASGLLLSACQTSGVQEVEPNMVRLDLTGVQFSADTEVAFKEVLAVAARETLTRGYTFFRLKDWRQGAPRIVTPSEPLTANFTVTIVMMNQDEIGSTPAFDARKTAPQAPNAK